MRILDEHESGKTVHGLAFSPAGQLVSACNDSTVRLWDVAGGTSQVLATRASAQVVSFFPDGHRLLYMDWTGLVAIHLATGGTTRLSLPDAPYPRCILFGGDGATLVVVASGRISLHDATTGAVRAVWAGSEHAASCLARDAEGMLVATAHLIKRKRHKPTERLRDYPVRLCRYPTGQLFHEFPDATDAVSSLAVSPDGRWLAATSSPTLWVWETATGAVVLRRKPDTRHFQSVAFSPDGRWLAATHNDRTVRLYAVGAWTEQETFDWKIGPIVSVCFSPDGMRAAAGSRTGKIVVWDVDP